MSYSVIRWDNSGQRSESGCETLSEALALAKQFRCAAFRTVKVGHCNNAVRHWTRKTGATGNHWSARATADEFFV